MTSNVGKSIVGKIEEQENYKTFQQDLLSYYRYCNFEVGLVTQKVFS